MEYLKLAESISSLGILVIIAAIFLISHLRKESETTPLLKDLSDAINDLSDSHKRACESDGKRDEIVEENTSAMTKLMTYYQRATEANEEQMERIIVTDEEVAKLREELAIVRDEIKALNELLNDHHIQSKEIRMFEEAMERRMDALNAKLSDYIIRKGKQDV